MYTINHKWQAFVVDRRFYLLWPLCRLFSLFFFLLGGLFGSGLLGGLFLAFSGFALGFLLGSLLLFDLRTVHDDTDGLVADELGAEGDVSSFVIPLGATINMDGTAIYQCVATIFLATCCGMTLTLGQMVTIVVTATLASIGTAGTPGAGMIMLAMVLEAMNIPVDMIMIIYGIDRLFDMGRTCLNITGDISCACCVTKWESKKAAQTAK